MSTTNKFEQETINYFRILKTIMVGRALKSRPSKRLTHCLGIFFSRDIKRYLGCQDKMRLKGAAVPAGNNATWLACATAAICGLQAHSSAIVHPASLAHLSGSWP